VGAGFHSCGVIGNRFNGWRLVLGILFLGTGCRITAASVPPHPHPFLVEHCVGCHGPEKQKGDFRIDTQLSLAFTNRLTAERWKEVLNVLNGHEMPPPKEPQPSPAATAAFVEWLTQELTQAEIARRATEVTQRRLNRDEYNRTLRALLGIPFDAGHLLPADPPSGGFDNNGAGLTLSPLHLELYFSAARLALDRALVLGAAPERLRWRFDPEEGSAGMDRYRVARGGQKQILLNGGRNRFTNGFTVLTIAGWDRNVDFRNFKVPVEGEYVIRMRAAGVVPERAAFIESVRPLLEKERDAEIARNPKGRRWHEEHFTNLLEHLRTEAMYDFGPPRVKVTQHLGGQPRVLREMDVDAPLDAPREIEFTARFTTKSAGLTFEYAYSIPKVLENHAWQGKDGVLRPELWIDWIEIEGPIDEGWPPRSHRAVISAAAEAIPVERDRMAAVLRDFMPRAWRRPVTGAEVDSKLALFDRLRPASADFQEALKGVLTSVLTSPHFLYLVEPGAPGTRLDAWALASRLSYFLWSAPPDEGLVAVARSGALASDAVLGQQVDRMLADPRSEAFVRNFAGQWLGLRQVGANPPASDLYPHYDRHLELSIVGESEAFFAEILRGDIDLRNFLRSDFVVINERLGRFYGIPGVRGDRFRRVALAAGQRRGGLATQGSVLTITSNGTRTSPVKRGVWVLRTLLGQDPGLPVANVGEIAPRVPGIDKATVRQRLQIHRELPACARCHDRIDPLGFALENFDASGAWRDREGHGYKGRIERNDPVIDASAKLPDGTEVRGIEGLQEALMAREELFLRALSERLYTYALGRELGLSDAPRIRDAVVTLQRDGRTLRHLIRHIVLSDAFRQP
jgi:hypothetical protein